MSAWELSKQRGNAAYGTQAFQDALTHYTQALEQAPPESQKHIILSNRYRGGARFL